MKKTFLVLGMAIAFLAGVGPAVADEANLPGHALSDKEAAARASNVFTGQLVSLDRVKAGSGDYIGKVIEVTRPATGIRPSVTTQNTTTPVPAIPSNLGIPIAMRVAAHETAPEVGKSYVIYGKDDMVSGVRGYEALKLSPTGEHGVPIRTF